MPGWTVATVNEMSDRYDAMTATQPWQNWKRDAEKMRNGMRISLRNASEQIKKNISFQMAGAAGFEPAHGGTKNRCLTAWLRPIIRSDAPI